MLKHQPAAAGLAIALSLAAPAFAQQPQTTPTGHPTSAFLRQEGADQWRGSRLIGATVYGKDNNSIGEVDDLLIGRDGEVRAVVIGVSDKKVALPFASLTIKRMQGSNAIDKIVASYSKQQLEQAPRFAFEGEPRPQTTGFGDPLSAPPKPPR
jgi:hypothetical protein